MASLFLLATPVTASAPDELFDLTTKEGIKAYIDLEATKMGVDATLIQKIIACESGYNGRAVGDSGSAVGLAQFWPETFTRMQRQSGIDPNALRPDYRAQIKILIWAVKNGHGPEWTCFTKYAK